MWLVNNFPWVDSKILCKNQVFRSMLLKSDTMGMLNKVCWMILQINRKELILGGLQCEPEFTHASIWQALG